MEIRVEWTLGALREFTLWIGAFARDEIDVRVARRVHLSIIARELRETLGHPRGGKSVTTSKGEVIVWEYASGEMWLSIRRVVRRASFFQRMIGARDIEAIIVTARRQPPTLQELESLPE
jgi:hypothetical protein